MKGGSFCENNLKLTIFSYRKNTEMYSFSGTPPILCNCTPAYILTCKWIGTFFTGVLILVNFLYHLKRKIFTNFANSALLDWKLPRLLTDINVLSGILTVRYGINKYEIQRTSHCLLWHLFDTSQGYDNSKALTNSGVAGELRHYHGTMLKT